MAWKAKLISVSPLAVQSDSLDVVIQYYDDANPTREVTKTLNYAASTAAVADQLVNLRAIVDANCLRLTRQDGMQAALEARVGQVVSS